MRVHERARALEPDLERLGSDQLSADGIERDLFLVRARWALGSRPGLALFPRNLGHDPYLGWSEPDRGSHCPFRHPLEVGHQGDEENDPAGVALAQASAAVVCDGSLNPQ